MAISFPINFPTIRGIADISWRAVRADMLSQSPLTFAQQVIQHQGQRWEADIVMPPMDRAEAEEVIGFLLSLDGRNGTFLLKPPASGTARGALGGTPLVDGGSQTGSELDIKGASNNITGWLKAGDYIQLWTAASSRLHKVVQDADSDGTGLVTLDIWPKLRESPTDSLAVTVADTEGVFRLEAPFMNWSIDDATIYGISFSVVEAL